MKEGLGEVDDSTSGVRCKSQKDVNKFKNPGYDDYGNSGDLVLLSERKSLKKGKISKLIVLIYNLYKLIIVVILLSPLFQGTKKKGKSIRQKAKVKLTVAKKRKAKAKAKVKVGAAHNKKSNRGKKGKTFARNSNNL